MSAVAPVTLERNAFSQSAGLLSSLPAASVVPAVPLLPRCVASIQPVDRAPVEPVLPSAPPAQIPIAVSVSSSITRRITPPATLAAIEARFGAPPPGAAATAASSRAQSAQAGSVPVSIPRPSAAAAATSSSAAPSARTRRSVPPASPVVSLLHDFTGRKFLLDYVASWDRGVLQELLCTLGSQIVLQQNGPDVTLVFDGTKQMTAAVHNGANNRFLKAAQAANKEASGSSGGGLMESRLDRARRKGWPCLKYADALKRATDEKQRREDCTVRIIITASSPLFEPEVTEFPLVRQITVPNRSPNQAAAAPVLGPLIHTIPRLDWDAPPGACPFVSGNQRLDEVGRQQQEEKEKQRAAHLQAKFEAQQRRAAMEAGGAAAASASPAAVPAVAKPAGRPLYCEFCDVYIDDEQTHCNTPNHQELFDRPERREFARLQLLEMERTARFLRAVEQKAPKYRAIAMAKAAARAAAAASQSKAPASISTADAVASISTAQTDGAAAPHHCAAVFSLPLCAAHNTMQNSGSTPTQPGSASPHVNASPSSASRAAADVDQLVLEDDDVTPPPSSPTSMSSQSAMRAAAETGTSTMEVVSQSSSTSAAGGDAAAAVAATAQPQRTDEEAASEEKETPTRTDAATSDKAASSSTAAAGGDAPSREVASREKQELAASTEVLGHESGNAGEASGAGNDSGTTKQTVAASSTAASSSTNATVTDGAGSVNDPAAASQGLDTPASSAAASSRPFTSSLKKVIKYVGQMSDHLIRPGTPAWEPGYPGVLVTEWADEEDQWAHPLSLVFVDDSKAREAQAMSTTLAAYQKTLPLLPYWNFGALADGDCMVRCAAMSDVARVNEDLEAVVNSIICCGHRDPVFLNIDVADKKARENEKNAISEYRVLLGETTLQSKKKLPEAIKNIGFAPDPEEAAPFLETLHKQPLLLCGWETMEAYRSWRWDRTRPMARLETIEVTPPKGIWGYARDTASLMPRSQSQHAAPIMSFVHYSTAKLVGTYMPSSSSSSSSSTSSTSRSRSNKTESAAAAGTAAAAVSMLGHTEPLIPAPTMLLQSPAHPLYPMEPMTWVPLGNPLTTAYFLTPAHVGMFRTRNKFAVPGANELKARTERLFPLAAGQSSSDSPFFAAVYHGSVVSYTVDNDDKEGEQQGVVVLTFVRQSSAGGLGLMKHLCLSALDSHSTEDGALSQDSSVIAAQGAMPARGPVAMLLVVPLEKVEGQAANICFQSVASLDDLHELQTIQSSDVTRVWRSAELGALGESDPSGLTLAALRHRTDTGDSLIKLANPAQPTPLRTAIEDARVQAMVLHSVEQMAAFTSDADGADFIEAIRRVAAGQGFPITTLLNARASMNCASSLPQLCGQSDNMLGLQKIIDAVAAEAPASQRDAEHGSGRPSRPAGVQARHQIHRTRAEDDDPAPTKHRKSTKQKKAASTGRSTSRKKDAASAKRPPSASSVKSAPTPKAKGFVQSDAEEEEEEEDEPSEELLQAAHDLCFKLGDINAPVSAAPLAPLVWNSWVTDDRYDPLFPIDELGPAIDEWKEVVWESIRYDGADDQLYEFLVQAAKESVKLKDAAELLSRNKSRICWRKEYEGFNGPDKDLLFMYSKGKLPVKAFASMSIWEQHCSGSWNGKQETGPLNPPATRPKQAKQTARPKQVAKPGKPEAKGKSKKHGRGAGSYGVLQDLTDSPPDSPLTPKASASKRSRHAGPAAAALESEGEEDEQEVPAPATRLNGRFTKRSAAAAALNSEGEEDEPAPAPSRSHAKQSKKAKATPPKPAAAATSAAVTAPAPASAASAPSRASSSPSAPAMQQSSASAPAMQQSAPVPAAAAPQLQNALVPVAQFARAPGAQQMVLAPGAVPPGVNPDLAYVTSAYQQTTTSLMQFFGQIHSQQSEMINVMSQAVTAIAGGGRRSRYAQQSRAYSHSPMVEDYDDQEESMANAPAAAAQQQQRQLALVPGLQGGYPRTESAPLALSLSSLMQLQQQQPPQQQQPQQQPHMDAQAFTAASASAFGQAAASNFVQTLQSYRRVGRPPQSQNPSHGPYDFM